MSQLISLNVKRRISGSKEDFFATAQQHGFDIDDIISPIKDSGTFRYFNTRQLKGNAPSSRSLGQTKYEVSDTLAAIAVMSESLALLTIVRRRTEDVANESAIFIIGKISENLIESNTGGTIFFYQEDGDPNLVEYEVSETTSQILSQLNPTPVPVNEVISITYAEGQALIAAGVIDPADGLIPGHHYKITDRADNGITLLAVDETHFSLEGEGAFLNPDFQDVGDYSGLVAETGIAKVTNYGVWSGTLEAANNYGDGDITFRNGIHYQMTNFAGKDLTDPYTNPGYTVLPKTVSGVGYIEEVDFIFYDFGADIIIKREDKRGNRINPDDGQMQWGNNQVTGNVFLPNSGCAILNQRGSLNANTFNSNTSYLYANNDFVGVLSGCTIESGNITLMDTVNLSACKFNTIISITISDGYTANGKEINSLGSNFEADLDMTDGDDYTASTDTLTIPTDLNFVGNFNLKDSSGQPIVNIENLPDGFEVEFKVADAGDTVIFTNTSIAGAVANNLVADVAGNNTLTGRTNGNDFIRYRKSGNLNVRTTGSIMA